jgi:DNA-directed RNA polymerase sigma subunit (sigma70/sigma32)
MTTPQECRAAGLTDREEYVILALDGWFLEPKTHDSIARLLCVTRDRIEVIERKGREKLASKEGRP